MAAKDGRGLASAGRRGVFGEAFTVGKAVAQAMRITAMNLFRKPVTVHYPTTVRPFPNRFRGLLALTYDGETGEENCIGCRLCEFICPPAVIKVEMLKAEKRNYAKTFTLELYACEFCELCVQVCPTDAIIMMKSFDLATADRREMLLDKDRLHAIGLQHEASWATGNRLRDMQQPPKKAAAEGTAAETAENADKKKAAAEHAENADNKKAAAEHAEHADNKKAAAEHAEHADNKKAAAEYADNADNKKAAAEYADNADNKKTAADNMDKKKAAGA